MSLDPAPVLVGAGQINDRRDDATLEPVDLMATAAREAADPRVFLGRRRHPGGQPAVLALSRSRTAAGRQDRRRVGDLHRVGGGAAITAQPGVRGYSARACRVIPTGRAETWRAKAEGQRGVRPDWTRQDGSVPVPRVASTKSRWPARRDHVGLLLPSHVIRSSKWRCAFPAGEASGASRAPRRVVGTDSARWPPPTRTPGCATRSRRRKSTTAGRTTG